MSDRQVSEDTAHEQGKVRGFLHRYRLPLMLGLLAVCLYAGSILYILYFRGQVS